ncbi:DedA family protein [Agathobaculum sp.]|uniref:DedA family protein n=1 Tax=Agathobaculum sp. TaxID=2048138 RepID=UPI003AB128F5
MTAAAFFELFHQYGLFLVCGVIFCEYMNLPGFPAGVIMPCIGVLIAQSSLSLPLTLVLSVASGLLGSLVIYGLCYWGGEPIMEKLFGKSRKFRSFVQKCHEFIDAQHGRGLALCRIIPMLRTIVSIPAGLIRMPVKWFVGWSAIGIAAWNTALISAGYLFSDRILTLVM